MPEAVIVSAARTPVGGVNKRSLKELRPDDLAAFVVKAAVEKLGGVDPSMIDGLYLGCGMPGAESGNNIGSRRERPQRLGLRAGRHPTRYCGSSVQTVRMAFHAIELARARFASRQGSRRCRGTRTERRTTPERRYDSSSTTQDVSWAACEAGPLNSHLSRIGTCLMRGLALWNVRTSAVEGGDPTRHAESLPTLELCQAEEGARILNAMVCDVTTCPGGGASPPAAPAAA